MLMNKLVGTVGYDNLVITAGDAGSIQLAAGQGTLKRGSIINEDGKLLNTASSKNRYVVTADTAYDSTKTYFTESAGTYTKAAITEFASGTTYYERIVEEVKPVYILCDDTETDDTETVTGIVWKNGKFVTESLITASGYTLTDTDIAQLRDVNIIVESAK